MGTEDQKQKARERALRYYYANKAKCLENGKKRRQSGIYRDRDRWYQIKKKFGITKDQYESLLRSQCGRCAICETANSGRKDLSNFAVDHDHETGKVRGLLCVQCNTALGNMKDDPQLLEKAAEYLRRNNLTKGGV